MVTRHTVENGVEITYTESKLRPIILNILYDLGFIDNSYFGEGTYGEFDHQKYRNYTKWTVIVLIFALFMAIVNGQDKK